MSEKSSFMVFSGTKSKYLTEKIAKSFKSSLKLNNSKIIGINPGAGKRWVMKKWRIEKYIKLIKTLSSKGYNIFLLGGKDDEEEIKLILKQKIKNVYSTGTTNSVQEFFAMVNLCDLIVCGDTMAMHAGLGLKKNQSLQGRQKKT